MSLNVQPIRDALNPILDTYLLSFTGLCTLLLPLSLSRSLDTGWLALYTAHCVAYCSVLLFTFVPLLARFRLVFIIAFFTLIGMASVLQFGFSAQGEVAFVAAMVIATIGFGNVGLLILSVIIFIILVTPQLAVILEPIVSTGVSPYMLEHTNWGFAVFWILFCGVSASYLVSRIVMETHSKSQQLDVSLAANKSIALDMMQLVDTANAPIFGIDRQGMVNEWNQQAEKITGFTKEEVMGLELVTTFIPDDYRQSVSEVLANALKGEETANYEFPLFTKSEYRVDILLNSTTRRDALGKIVGVVGVGQDITELNTLRAEQENERKKASAQIVQASKLATLGEMATSVAHELNQPLNVIRIAAENGRRKISTGDADTEYLTEKLERIVLQTARAAKIIEHMRMFGREAKEEPESINPRVVVTNALELVGEQLRLDGIEITTDFAHDCPSILGHAIQMEQVIINLLTNARDAMAQQPGASLIILKIRTKDNDVHIVVEDNGEGIPDELLERIFEPFYTTKDMAKGTGLGLSVSYGIIRDMGGSIVAENVHDGGARFTISLKGIS